MIMHYFKFASVCFTCKEHMVKLKFHNFRQVICACENHMEALLKNQNKNLRLDHDIFTFNQFIEYYSNNHKLRANCRFGIKSSICKRNNKRTYFFCTLSVN